MPLAIDGFKVFKAIGKNAKAFSDIHPDVNKQAMALVSKQIKKSTFANLREVFDAIGDDNFKKIVDDLKGIGPLVKRLDKHHPNLKKMNAQQQRELLNALANGSASAHEKPVKKSSAKAAKKTSKKNTKNNEWEDFESMKPRER